jgi:CheY-like chemotaxis protein
MGFDVCVKSSVGVGSIFSLVFSGPANAGSDAATALQDELAPMGNHATPPTRNSFVVLVIDDESDAREILGRSFVDLGCTVVTASSADEGINLARRIRPDLITLDLMMPRKNGWDALHELKSDILLRGIPVTVVSVVAQENRGHIVGAAHYLDKPVTREDLAEIVFRHMSDRQREHLALGA